MTQPPQPDYGQTAKKAGTVTVTVLAVLVGLFCVLPVLICGGLAMIGSIDFNR